MDALSQIQRVICLDSAIYRNGKYSEHLCLTSPDSGALTPMVAPAASRSSSTICSARGRAYVHLHDGTGVARTRAIHRLSTRPRGLGRRRHAGHSRRCNRGVPALLECGLETIHMGGGGLRSRFICGYRGWIRRSARLSLAACRCSSRSTFATMSMASDWRRR